MLPPGAGSAKRGFVENQEISKGSPEVYQISWGMSGEIFVRLGKELRVSREDFESEQDAPTTAWGETLQLRWVDERPDFLACFVIFCLLDSYLENPCEFVKSVVRNSLKNSDLVRIRFWQEN